MEKIILNHDIDDINELWVYVKDLIKEGKLVECEEVIRYAMYLYPSSPIPHNLYGILFEVRNEQIRAMKHFRAALDLDPTFLPAKENLMTFGTLSFRHKFVYCQNNLKPHKRA